MNFSEGHEWVRTRKKIRGFYYEWYCRKCHSFVTMRRVQSPNSESFVDGKSCEEVQVRAVHDE